MVQLKKWPISMTKNCRNLGVHQVIEIFSVLHNAQVIPRDQARVVFYINNYIDWDQFDQLYGRDWLKKYTWNADAMARKLGPTSIKATNLRLKVAKVEV